MKEKKLLRIARLAASELKTLKVRDGDALEYIEVNLMGLKNAICTAYDLGWLDAEKGKRR